MSTHVTRRATLPWLVTCATVFFAGCAPSTGSIGAILVQGKKDGRVAVREAPEGYPAALAGVQAGDELLFVDGRDVRSMSPEAIHLALEGQVGTTVRLTLLRAGSIERIEVSRVALAPPSTP